MNVPLVAPASLLVLGAGSTADKGCLLVMCYYLHTFLLLQVQQLRQQEQGGQQSKPKRPRAVVLGPTRELTDQILQVAKSLCHHARFRSACVNGGVHTYCSRFAHEQTIQETMLAAPSVGSFYSCSLDSPLARLICMSKTWSFDPQLVFRIQQ